MLTSVLKVEDLREEAAEQLGTTGQEAMNRLLIERFLDFQHGVEMNRISRQGAQQIGLPGGRTFRLGHGSLHQMRKVKHVNVRLKRNGV